MGWGVGGEWGGERGVGWGARGGVGRWWGVASCRRGSSLERRYAFCPLTHGFRWLEPIMRIWLLFLHRNPSPFIIQHVSNESPKPFLWRLRVSNTLFLAYPRARFLDS